MSTQQLPMSCRYLVLSSAAFLRDVTEVFLDLLSLDDIWYVMLLHCHHFAVSQNRYTYIQTGHEM